MAPEQALNTRLADQRADIYSLGMTLWYLLTGRPVFGGETVMEKLLAHREKPIPSLQEACPGATPALEVVFTKMVAKKAEDRYQSMSEVVAELEGIRSGRFAAVSVADAQGEDDRRPEFLGCTNPPMAASAHPSGKFLAVEKRPSSSELEATITMAGPQGDTDPTTEQSLVVPPAGQPIGRLGAGSGRWTHWLASVGRRTWVLAACAVGTAVFAGIVLFLERGTLRIEINDPAIEVVVDGKGATIKGTKPEEIILEPGYHDLRIKYGELNFETNSFFLGHSEKVTLKVELLTGKVQVIRGDTVLGERPLPAISPFDAKQAVAYQDAWAKHLGTKVEIENSLGMKMRLIPPGEFLMGSPQAVIDALVQTTTNANWQQ
jgi:hypothetical protein